MRRLLTVCFLLLCCVVSAQSLALLVGGRIALTGPAIDTGSIDDSNTVTLFRFDEDFSDQTGLAWTVTRGSSFATKITDLEFKFGGGSLSDSTNVSGSQWSLVPGSVAPFQFGTGDFTVDYWFNASFSLFGTLSTTHPLIAFNFGDYMVRQDYYLDGTLARLNVLCMAGSDIMTLGLTPPAITANQWYHCCFQRTAGEFAFFLDGVKYNLSTDELGTADIAPGSVSIVRIDNAGLKLPYYIDELRISNVSRFGSGNFTPPTQAYGRLYNPRVALSVRQAQPYPQMIAWYDATDNDTVILSGSDVIEWRDKSGNNYHAVASTTLRPTVSSIAGEQAIRFTGGQYLDAPSDVVPVGNASYTFYIVFLTDDPHPDDKNHTLVCMGVQDGGALLEVSVLAKSADDKAVLANFDVSSTLAQTATHAVPHVLMASNDAAAGISQQKLSIDGNLAERNYTAKNTTSSVFRIGKAAPGVTSAFGEELSGEIGEILVYHEQHNEETRDLIISSLQEKWGL